MLGVGLEEFAIMMILPRRVLKWLQGIHIAPRPLSCEMALQAQKNRYRISRKVHRQSRGGDAPRAFAPMEPAIDGRVGEKSEEWIGIGNQSSLIPD